MNDELGRLLAFLKTRTTPDELATAEQLKRWLVAHELLGEDEPLGEADWKRVKHLRAALVSLVSAPDHADERTRTTIAEATKVAPLQVVVGPAGELQLAAAGDGVDNALARLVVAAHHAVLTGEFERLKACKACGWTFFDATRNHSRIWCDMATCGNPIKAKHYRERKAAQPSPPVAAATTPSPDFAGEGEK